MRVLILGHGKEGQSSEKYFKKRGDNVEIIDNFNVDSLKNIDFSQYDLILRSPSALVGGKVSSATRYFFDNIKAPVIGVTGTKGKGTTCSLISEVLRALGEKVYLVGNIGKPAIDILDRATENDVIVYEMSSFQLWDLDKSPHISVILRIEPDHLDVHKDFDDYINAKGHIAEFQSDQDSVIYFKDNPDSVMLAQKGDGKKISYPIAQKTAKLQKLLDSLRILGNHNKENAQAALLAVAAYYGVTVDELIERSFDKIKTAFEGFGGLPHHIEFVRELNGVKYYDDSFSASYPSLETALKAFPGKRVVLIAGGKDRQLNLSSTKRAIFDSPELEKAILIGETKDKLSDGEDPEKYILCDSLEEATRSAQKIAEESADIVLLSPGAASFDMFHDFYERGDLFKKYVGELR